jgi:arsenate reductase-like glutaredoxin family protein
VIVKKVDAQTRAKTSINDDLLRPNRKDPRSDAEYILLLRDHPALLRRPFAVIGDEFLIGFSGGHYEKRFRRADSPS